MARTKGSMKLAQNIEPQVSAPLDARLMVRTIDDLTNEKSYEYPYVGMIVMCKENMTQYLLVDKDTTKAESWEVWSVKQSESGGGGSQEVDLSDYYTKTEVDDLLSNIDVPTGNTYTKAEIDAALNTKADKDTTYTKTEVDNLLDDKADASDVVDAYTKDETYSKEEVDELIGSLSPAIDDPDDPEEPSVDIVTWANGTDEQIVAMIEAADRGEINLYDYWSVGDERIIYLNEMSFDSSIDNAQQGAQSICMVLIESGEDILNKYTTTSTSSFYDLVTIPASGRTKPWFLIGMKNNLYQKGAMHTSSSILTDWGDCARRPWCNNNFKMAFPSIWQRILKQIKMPFIGGNYGSIKFSEDYFAPYCKGEVMDTSGYFGDSNKYLSAIPAYFKPFKYFSDFPDRKYHKNGGGNNNVTRTGWGSTDAYWDRTIYSEDKYLLVTNYEPSGASARSYDYASVKSQYGISLFGAI